MINIQSKIETIKINNTEKKICRIIINEPPVNSLSTELLKNLQISIEQIHKDHLDLSLCILTSNRDKIFIAGANLKEMQMMQPQEAKEYTKLAHKLFLTIQNSPLLFIAMINGLALGGGLEVVLACDIRIASETSKFSFPETSLGLIPGFGGTQRFLKQLGLNNTLYYILTGKQLSAQEAKLLGLIQEVHLPEELESATKKLIKIILQNGPNAIQKVKQLLYESLDMSLENGLMEEQKAFSNLFSTDEPREGITAFLEKRKANFKYPLS